MTYKLIIYYKYNIDQKKDFSILTFSNFYFNSFHFIVSNC